MRRLITTTLAILAFISVAAVALTDPIVQDNLMWVLLGGLVVLFSFLLGYWIGKDHGAIEHSKKVRGLWGDE